MPASAGSGSRQQVCRAKQRCHHPFWLTFKDSQLECNFAGWLARKCRPMNVLLGSALLAMAVFLQCKEGKLQTAASLAAAGALLVVTSTFSQTRQVQTEILYGLFLTLHTAAASSMYLPQWPAGANPLTWTSRALGCEALVIAPVSMMICFRRLVVWQSAAVAAASLQIPLR
ncbi:hypothetical protein WJX73_005281 [Symbiochloris irregularis]|uniref:Uncharacterized protein n=1 Tax=Symbiochloris irregularis TaxID=706552 RepID=A0AAW1P4C4_9CHLO